MFSAILLIALGSSAAQNIPQIDVPGYAGGFVWPNQGPQAGDTVANTASETSFASALTLPANLLTSKMLFHMTWYGTGSTLPGGGTLTFRLNSGPTNLFTSQAYTVDNTVWYVDADLQFISDGASGFVEVGARSGVGPGTGNFVGSSGKAGGVTLNTTTACNLGLLVQFSVANSGNTVTQRMIVPIRLW